MMSKSESQCSTGVVFAMMLPHRAGRDRASWLPSSWHVAVPVGACACAGGQGVTDPTGGRQHRTADLTGTIGVRRSHDQTRDLALGRCEVDSHDGIDGEGGDGAGERHGDGHEIDETAEEWRMSRPAWNLGDGPEQLSYAATSSLGV